MAKTSASKGRVTRQSRRLNPELVEEEDNDNREDQAKNKEEEDQKVVEDKPEIEVSEVKGESEAKPASEDVQDDRSESCPVAVETEDQVEDEPEDVRTGVEHKPETKEGKSEATSTDVQPHPDVSLQEEIKDGRENQVETTCPDVQADPEVSPKEDQETKDDEEEQMETTLTGTRAHPDVSVQDEIKNGDDAETEAVIEVKGCAPTVSVSWEKDEQPEEAITNVEDLTTRDNTEISKEEQVDVTSTTDQQEDMEVPQTEEIKDGEEEKAPATEIVLVESDEEPEQDDDIEIIEDQETQATEEKEDAETEAVIEVKGGAPTVSVSWEKDEQPEEAMTKVEDLTTRDNTEIAKDVEMELSAIEENESEIGPVQEKIREEEADRNKETTEKTKQKRKAKSPIDSSPVKKVKLINDGYCLYVGNLDQSKYYEEIRNALEKYFMTQSLLVLDIRLDKAKKHAFVDVASQFDLTKALKLNGQKLLDKPLRIRKAKVKEVDLEQKKKDPKEVQKAKNERCLHVENIPSSATKDDLLKVFPKAIAVRFLGGTDSPRKSIAFVEFQSKKQADAVRSQSGPVQIQGCSLRVNVVKETAGVHKTTSQSKNKAKAEASPTNTLFVSNLPVRVQEKHLKRIFRKAVKINIPQRDGKSKGFAFVEFASVAHATKALKSSKSSSIEKKPLKIQFAVKSKPPPVASQSLIVLGLHEHTSADTLTQAFDGALTSRIFVDKDTGRSKRFGFVDFESADSCRRAKEAAEDVEIDGRKVTVAFARPRHVPAPDSGERGNHRGERNGQTPGKRKRKGRKAGGTLLKKSKVSNIS